MPFDLDTLARDAAASAPAPTALATLEERAGRRRRRRRAASGAVVLPIVLVSVVGIRSALDARVPTEVIAAGGAGSGQVVTQAPSPGSLGEFAWPAPARDFATREALHEAFVSEVLGWSTGVLEIETTAADDLVGAETLRNGSTGAEVRVLAVETDDGWGYVEIGDHALDLEEGPPLAYSLSVPSGTARAVVELRFDDGTVEVDEVTRDVQSPRARDAEVVSAFVTYVDADGSIVSVTGGVYSFGDEAAAVEVVDPFDEGAPSQSTEDAERDGVVPALAELPAMVRIVPSPSADLVESSEGTWLVSEPAWKLLENSCLGDEDGTHGADFVCLASYAEILLLDADGSIERAYPFVGTRPFSLFETEDAIYCGRGGDGGVPDSMLCRIDRATSEITVRVFASLAGETVFPSDSDWMPPGWTIDAESGTYVDWQAGVALTDEGLVVGVGDTAVVFDPVTLHPGTNR